MKQKFILIILFSVIFGNNAYSQIPNSDFENWIWVGWFSNPEGWSTNNMQITSSVVTPDTDAYSGTYAMQLYNYGIIKPIVWTRFASSTNVSELTAYVKLNPVFDDTVFIKVREFYNGTLVDSGEWKGFTYIPVYIPVTVMVSQNNNNIDTIEIEIDGGDHTNLVMTGTTFKVDHLELALSNGITVCPGLPHAELYPNPVKDFLFINLYDDENISEVKIFNDMGMEVKKISAGSTGISQIQSRYSFRVLKIDMRDIAGGNYFVLLENAETSRVYRCIKQ